MAGREYTEDKYVKDRAREGQEVQIIYSLSCSGKWGRF